MVLKKRTLFALDLLKILIYIYDVITLPFYFIFQKPWKQWKRKSTPYSRHIRSHDPHSPIVRLPERKTPPVEGVKNVNDLFLRAVHKYGDKPCLGVRELYDVQQETQPDGKAFTKLVLGDYQWQSFKEVDRRVDRIARGFLGSGIRPRQNVVIFAETRVEWTLTLLACFRNNIPIVTVYATLGPEGVIHAVNESDATHIVTSVDLLAVLKKSIQSMPKVTTLIYMEGMRPPSIEFPENITLIPFGQLEKTGETSDPAVTGEVPGPEDLAVIMYTSGSTGVPKGVMILHKNVVTTSLGLTATGPQEWKDDDVYVAYLPLAHILEITLEYYALTHGVPIGYATPNTLLDHSTALKRGVRGDISVLQPTMMGAVPLILDRIRKGVLEGAESRGAFAKAFISYCSKYKQFWTGKGFGTPIMNRWVFKKFESLLGGRMRLILIGGAPLSPETQGFIESCLNTKILQGYGLTETAAGATFSSMDDYTTGRVGPPMAGICIKLADWEEGGYRATDRPCPRGEIVVGGNTVTQGYFKNEQLTNECYKTEGGIRWFNTGDIGQLDPDGCIRIIDRKKDLVKLQFGEYISLGKVESELKSCPLVDNICVYGNSFYAYVVALVVPNVKQLQSIASSLGKDHLSFPDLCSDADVVAAALRVIREQGVRCKLQRVEIPQKIILCQEEWSPSTGMVTAALKLRRKDIEKFYQKKISNIYSNGDTKSV